MLALRHTLTILVVLYTQITIYGQCPLPTIRWQAYPPMYTSETHGVVLHSDSALYVVFNYSVYTAVAKVGRDGHTYWMRYLDAENMTALHPTHIISHSSGDLIIAGQGTAGDAVVIRIDTAANSVWTRRLMPGVAGQFQVRSLREWPDGDIAVIGEGTDVYVSPSGVDGIYARIHPDGTIEWERDFGGWEHDGFSDGLIAPDGVSLMFGRTESFSSGPWMVRVHPNALLASHLRLYTDLGEIAHANWLSNGDVLLVGRHFTQLGIFDVFALRMDTAGAITWSMNYRMPGRQERALSSELAPTGEVLIAFEETQTDSLGVFAIDPSDGALLWGYQYDGLLAAGNVDHSDPLVVAPDGSMYLCGSALWDGGVFRGPVVIQIDPCGGHGCGDRPWTPVVEPWGITSLVQPVVDINWQASTNVATSMADTWPVVTDSADHVWCGSTGGASAEGQEHPRCTVYGSGGAIVLSCPDNGMGRASVTMMDLTGRTVLRSIVDLGPDGSGRLERPALSAGPYVVMVGPSGVRTVVVHEP